jgi:hypothetical protein
MMAALHSFSAVPASHSLDAVAVLSHKRNATFYHAAAACSHLPLHHEFLRKSSFLLSASEHPVLSRCQADYYYYLLLLPDDGYCLLHLMVG